MQSDQLSALFPFLTSLALGLLIGLERERSPAATRLGDEHAPPG